MQAYLQAKQNGEDRKLFNLRQRPTRLKAFMGLVGVLYIGKEWYKGHQHKAEVELRKQRIRQPVYQLSEEEMINPPWVDNYDEWKYRRVSFKGRYVFRYSGYVPNKINNYQGFEFLVPIITKEDEKLENRKGLIVNKGWLPHDYKDPSDRFGFEDSINYKQVVGVVNKGEHYKKKGWKTFFQRGNVSDEQQFEINNFDLDFIAKVSEFQNQKSMSQAVVELIDYKDGDNLNPNDPNIFCRDLSMDKKYPFVRTGSDFLRRGSNDIGIVSRILNTTKLITYLVFAQFNYYLQ